ncbi:MAG: hypothetical protein J3K34DRAFT_417420 [Monoraphidium minutum]|nr:MAG: hypothetical protein J3K34DRAFT_417420 [Monoraphidium minutum]
MALSMQQARRATIARGPLAAQRPRVAKVVAKATTEERSMADKAKQVALASLLTATILTGSSMVAPEEALAARSGGRVSSSGFSSRRAAPAKAAPARSSTTVINRTTVVAPPLVGGYGFGMPFFGGFGGMGYGMGFMPFPFFGGIIQIMFLLVIVNVVFSLVKGAVNAANSAGNGKSKDDGDWDKL